MNRFNWFSREATSQILKIQEHTIRNYYRFTMRTNVGEGGYQRWASGIQTRHGQVAKYT